MHTTRVEIGRTLAREHPVAADLVTAFGTACAQAGLAVDNVELAASARLHDPMAILGLSDGDPSLAALELKLFEDSRDTIKLKNLVSSVIDDETQQKIDIVKHYGLSPEKVVVTGAGFDDTLFRAAPKPDPRPVQLVYAGKFIQAIVDMRNELALPLQPKDLKASDIPGIVDEAIAEAGSLYPVPRYMSEAELTTIVNGLRAA